MEKDLLAFAAALKEMRLSPSEKERMMRVILATSVPAWQPVHFLFSLRQITAVTAALVLLTGSGISYATEGALPGNLLYPVKVGVNERIRARFALSAQAHARWQARLAERRLEEGEILASRELLTDEVHADLVHRFQAHAASASTDIEAMLGDEEDLENAAVVSTDFETALMAHASLLEQLERGHVSRRILIHDLREAVQSRTRLVAQVRQRAHARVRIADAGRGLEAAAASTMEATGKRIDKARSFLAARPPKMGTMAEEAARKLMSAEEKLDRVRQHLQTESIDETIEQVNAAFTTAQEVSLFLKHGDEEIVDRSTSASAQEDAALVAQIRIVAQHLTKTRKLFAQRKKFLTPEEVHAVTEMLKKADASLQAARASMQAFVVADARVQAEASMTLSKKARTIISKNESGAAEEDDETESDAADTTEENDVDAGTSAGTDDTDTAIDSHTDNSIKLPLDIEVEQAVHQRIEIPLQ